MLKSLFLLSAFGILSLLHPTGANELKKIKQHKSSVYLLNTGWTGELMAQEAELKYQLLVRLLMPFIAAN